MLCGCVTYAATLAMLVFNIIGIVRGFTNSVGAWPIIGMMLATIVLMIIGCGLGLLFQAVAYFIKRFSSYKCVCQHANKE